MSVASPPPVAPAEPRERVLAPLRQVQRGIRTYIITEGLTWAAIGVACWCLVTFLFDAGLLHALAGVDYLRDGLVEGHRAARLLCWLALWGGLIAVLGYHLIWRLRVPIDLESVALVVERKFPRQLEERLLTSVELSDRRRAETLGLSWPLLEETTEEASRRLAELPLHEVFDRDRLRRLLGVAGGLWGAAFALGLFFTHAVAGWGDRQIWLREAYWPRATIIEIADFGPDRTRAVPYGLELPLQLRGWKWVVADTDHPEGWRPVDWVRDLLPAERGGRAWELAEPVASPVLFAALPPTWQKLTLDEVEARIEAQPLFEIHRRELGLAAAAYLLSRLEEPAALETVRNLLPATWRGLATPALREHLLLARRFTPAEVLAMLETWKQLRPVDADFAAALAGLQGTPMPWLPPHAWLQQLAATGTEPLPPFAVPLAELRLLPASWRELDQESLRTRLSGTAAGFSAEALGDHIRGELLEVLAELGRRVDQSHIARRRTLRRLEVPARIALEFEQILEGEERLRQRPKRGKPEVRRRAGSMEYPFEFKKVEQPLRFRVVAGAGTSLWHRVEVRSLPSLRRLERWHDEPGYLHESLERVTVGPLPLPLDGDESRADAPVGSRVRIEGESYKPLQQVRLLPAGPLETSPGEVLHTPGSATFQLLLAPVVGPERRLRLELEDGDGIVLARRLLVVGVPDREPEFPRVSFDVVSRKMITPQALMPLTAVIRDDHGLTAAGYEVTLERPNRTVEFRGFVPLRRFEPVGQVQPGTGYRFEQVGDIRLGRLLADQPGDPFSTLPALLRLPVAGPWGFAVAPRFEPTREFISAYEDRNLYGPVLKPTDEFLDTLLLRLQAGKALNEPILNPPYRLLVRLVAYDNRTLDGARVVPAPQTGRAAEVFDFQVVTEQELLIEVGKREEELRDRCEEIVEGLREVRRQLGQLEQEVATLADADARAAAGQVRHWQRLMPQTRAQLEQRVLRDFRQVYRELALNRCAAPVLDRVDKKICQPLAELLDSEGGFPAVADALERLARRLEGEGNRVPIAAIAEAMAPLDRLLAQLENIMAEMKKLIEFNQALQKLRELITDLDSNLQRLEQKRKEQQRRELEDR
ncbi:MAG TPA: hypothetical protein PKC45_00875 [Gemmatales bacterium]|nr:hypothetical protein [Gemmatales bacterium]